ncbi:LOW QUALITY PROTEIN: hypothetical protein Cgig2_011977 [Carnegiea gigantea]|uniref:Uncharacterized protein n=1 Tax=Carnegiea gigantea TaxID=171969 RepID=A0A9Q1JEH5_9CARY|nr:LOW QUALITY PROTEIN: hypothetical protein Cgig2_011977 [Carnegiea gigantea]
MGLAWGCLPIVASLKRLSGLIPSYELAVAEEATQDYELPEQFQVIFYAILLNEAKRLGVLCGRALRALESTLTELRWSTFESWVWQYGDWIFEAHFQTKVAPEESSEAGPQEESSEVELEGEGLAHEGRPPLSTTINREEVVQRDTREHRKRSRWKRASRPPCPLPEDFHPLCPRFSLPEAKGTVAGFELPKMVTFYAILLNELPKMAEGLKSALVGLRWSSFEVWMSCVNHKLREAQFRRQAVAGEVRGPLDGQEESSGSNGPPALSSDKE